MGTLMMLNVWGIIWPNQKIVIGLKEGDAAIAGPKALLASRTNTLFSFAMLYFMLASVHGPGAGSLSELFILANGSLNLTTGLLARNSNNTDNRNECYLGKTIFFYRFSKRGDKLRFSFDSSII